MACCGGRPEFLDQIPYPSWNFPTGLRAGFFMPVVHGGGESHAQQRTLHGRGGFGLAELSCLSVDAGLFHIGSGYVLARMPGEGSQGGISPSYRGAFPSYCSGLSRRHCRAGNRAVKSSHSCKGASPGRHSRNTGTRPWRRVFYCPGKRSCGRARRCLPRRGPWATNRRH